MIRLSENGAFVVNGEVVEDGADIKERLGKLGVSITKEEAKKNGSLTLTHNTKFK